MEVVCGEAPWESREAEHGVVAPRGRTTWRAADVGPGRPLLGTTVARADRRAHRAGAARPGAPSLPARTCLDGKIVLPAAVALEMMAEAAQSAVAGLARRRGARTSPDEGRRAVDAGGRELQVFISPPPYGSSEGFEVSAALQSELPGGRAMTHYRCVIRLEQTLPAALPVSRLVHDDKPLSVAKAYGEWLFHGPRFQVIERFEGLSPAGAGCARCASPDPSLWLARGQPPTQPGWLFDPGLLDAAAQMAWLWARAYRDESALPARFGRVVALSRRSAGASAHAATNASMPADPSLIRGNVSLPRRGGRGGADRSRNSTASPARR